MTVQRFLMKVNIMTDDAIAAEREKDLGNALSLRIRILRLARKLSLDALSSRSGLSKGTVVAIEQGKANPSIGVLCRLAAAFSISVTDLLGDPPEETSDNPILRTEPITLWKTKRGSEAKLEASISGRTMFEIWSWKISPGDVYRSEPHSNGTRELISVKSGSLNVTVGSETMVLKAGEAARLVADQPHAYAPAGRQLVSFTMAVLERGGQTSS